MGRDGRSTDLYERLVAAADGIYGGSRPGTRALHAKGAWCEGTFTASPAAAEPVDRVPPPRRAGCRPDPLLERPGRPRGRRRRARGARVRGQAARRRRAGDRHPRHDHARVRHPHPRGVPRAARAAPARSRDRPARLREARRLPRRPPRGADRDPGHRRRRAAGQLRHRRLLLASHVLPRRRRRRAQPGPLPLDPRGGGAAAGGRRRQGAGPRLPLRGPGRAASPATARSPSSCASSARTPTTRSTTRPRCGPTSASSSTPAGSRSPRLVDDPERDGHIDVFDPLRDHRRASSPPTTRSCTRAAAPTRSPPTGAGAGRRARCPSSLSRGRPPGLQALLALRDHRGRRRHGR